LRSVQPRSYLLPWGSRLIMLKAAAATPKKFAWRIEKHPAFCRYAVLARFSVLNPHFEIVQRELVCINTCGISPSPGERVVHRAQSARKFKIATVNRRLSCENASKLRRLGVLTPQFLPSHLLPKRKCPTRETLYVIFTLVFQKVRFKYRFPDPLLPLTSLTHSRPPSPLRGTFRT